jgi:hypothetical protein
MAGLKEKRHTPVVGPVAVCGRERDDVYRRWQVNVSSPCVCVYVCIICMCICFSVCVCSVVFDWFYAAHMDGFSE